MMGTFVVNLMSSLCSESGLHLMVDFPDGSDG